MNYCLVGSESGNLPLNDFNYVIVNAFKFGNLEDLVVLKKGTQVHKKLDIPDDTIIILDKYRKFLSSSLLLVQTDEEDIEMDYLKYLSKISDTKSNKYKQPVDSKEKYQMFKNLISPLLNVMFEVTEYTSSDGEKYAPEEILFILNSFLKQFKMRLICSNGILAGDKVNEMESEYKYHRLSLKPDNGYDIPLNGRNRFNVPLKFFNCFIIKDEEMYSKLTFRKHIYGCPTEKRITKPLLLYVDRELVSSIIGTKGSNINLIRDNLNDTNTIWKIPFIKVSALEERENINTRNKIDSIVNELLKNIMN